jgi:hypothetical protein
MLALPLLCLCCRLSFGIGGLWKEFSLFCSAIAETAERKNGNDLFFLLSHETWRPWSKKTCLVGRKDGRMEGRKEGRKERSSKRRLGCFYFYGSSSNCFGLMPIAVEGCVSVKGRKIVHSY